ncbi:MAG TPA: PspC domain-containing protein [Acidimicrobiales bacterium]|nr:PspC domain-containing protein [Acidimicrobiales bacterium]
MTSGPEPRRLYREPEEQKVAGVCGGLADYIGVDPTIVRLALVLVTLTTWFGIPLYAIAAIVIPRRPDQVPRQQAPQRLIPEGSTTPVVVGLLVLAALAMMRGNRPWFDVPTIGFVLLGLGVWLFVADRDGSPQKVGPPFTATSGGATTLTNEVAPPPGAAGDTTEDDLATRVPSSVPDDSAVSADPQGEVPPPVPPWGFGSPELPAPPIPPAPPPPPVPFDRQRGLILSVLCIGAGIVALLTALDVVSFGFSTTVAGGLVVIGAGMVVGAIRGRARWLIGLGIPAVALLLLDDMLTVPFDAGIGDRTVVVDRDGRNTEEHEMAIGELMLDLRYVEGDRRDPPRIEAAVGAGNLVVLVPPDMTARVDADVGAGNITARGGGIDEIEDDGVDVSRSFTLERDEDTPEGEGRLVELDLRVDLGEVEVHHG